MKLLVVLVVAGLGTYLLRISMVVASERFGTPGWLRNRLPLVGPAVLAALVSAALFAPGGVRALPGLAEFVAVAAAFVAVRRTRNVGAALAVGLPLYWIGTALGTT